MSRVQHWASVPVLIALIIPLVLVGQPARAATAPGVSLSPAVRAAVQGGKSARFFVVLGDEPDVSGAYGITDWNARGQFVYDRLTANAAASQGELRKYLE